MSLAERPLAWNLLMSWLRVEVGGGMTPLLAAEKLAVFESLLPSLTSQSGPPSYNNQIQIFLVKNHTFFLGTADFSMIR